MAGAHHDIMKTTKSLLGFDGAGSSGFRGCFDVAGRSDLQSLL